MNNINQIDDGLQQPPQQPGEQPPPIELDPAFGQDPEVADVAADASGEASDDSDVVYVGEVGPDRILVFRQLPGLPGIQIHLDAEEERQNQLVLERAIRRRDELENTENKDPNVTRYNNNNIVTEDDIVIVQFNPEDPGAQMPTPGPSNPPGNNRRRPRSPGSPSPNPTRRMRM